MFKIPKKISVRPLKIGITWLYFLNSNNFFTFSVVIPTMINGETWPSPKKNKNVIEIIGFFDWDTQARSVAKTGVTQGEDASPKATPVITGTKNLGTLFLIFSRSGLFGNWNFKKPNKFKPITIANNDMPFIKILGSWPYIFPKSPLNAPRVTNDNTTPPQKPNTLNSLGLFSEPPIYAIVMGRRDNEHGPKLVNNPAANIKNKVTGLGLLTACCISKFPCWANSEITRFNEIMLTKFK